MAGRELQVLKDILARCGVDAADGRALHAYETTADEIAALRRLLPFRINPELRSPATAQAFVLWACEHIRTTYPGGQLTWEFVFEGLGLTSPDYFYTQWLVETGLTAWRRRIRRSDLGHREFLYTLVAEGGLPDAALAEGNRYATVLLRLIADLEAEGALAPVAAALAAQRYVGNLPQALRHDEQARLLADLALGLVDLRSALPDDLPADAALVWLDANRPGWRATLPLRMSARALEAVVRPALVAAKVAARSAGAPVQRELRKDAGGTWRGVVRILDGGLLPESLLPESTGQRLRLVAESGASFLARPDASGWRLARTSGSDLLALSPDEAVLLTAYVDGTRRGDLVVDPGLPTATEAPSLWRPADTAATEPDMLLPLSGRGHTRAGQVWLLAGSGVTPDAGDGVRVGSSTPAPGGRIWCLSGQGRITVDGCALTIATGADKESPTPQLAVFGTTLTGLTASGGAPVHLGEPQVWGAEGDAPLRPLGQRLRLTRLPRTLGGQIAEWVEDGVVLARARLLTLPASARFSMVETGARALRVTATGLQWGWHLSVTAGDAEARAVIAKDETVVSLRSQGLPGFVHIGLSDPAKGASIDLSGLWPARQPRLIDPQGSILEQDREISLTTLAGWRGHVPGNKGALLLRVAGKTNQIGFHASGNMRLAGMSPVIGQALALAGADGRVNLRLAEGVETPRLSIGRYDWASEEAGPFRHLGHGQTLLQAVHLDDPTRTAEVLAKGRIDLAGWLGNGEGLWLIQGRDEARGVLRPFVWAAVPQPHSSRDARMTRFAAMWSDLLEAPADPRWDQIRTLISAVRGMGDAGALDQVQALVRTPGAAVALLFMADRADRAVALALETEAPIWWPLLSCRAWAQGVKMARARITARLAEAGIEDDAISTQAMARAAGEIFLLRPELKAHLGQAFVAVGLPPMATDAQDSVLPLAATPAHLQTAAQDAARRYDTPPQGTDGLRATRLTLPAAANETNATLMHAPLVAAEVAAGLRSGLSPDETLRLIALRAADPMWFDAALPAALTMALNLPEAAR